MGIQAQTPAIQISITAETQCSTESRVPISIEETSTEGPVGREETPAPLKLPALFGFDLPRALWKQVQFFRPELDSIEPAEPAQALPLACNSVNVSGSASFGDVYVGNSATRTFTISNPNCCSVNYNIAGAPYGYTLSSSSGTISANSSTTVTITFRPPSDQSYSGSISVSPGGGSVSMSGRGIRR